MSRLTLVIVVLTMTQTLVACSDEVVETPLLRPVRLERVFATGGDRVRTFSGAAQSAVEAPLSFRVAGTVSRTAVSVGNNVTTGQLIAQLNPEDYQLQLQDAQAALQQAEANARNADANYGRVRGLYENNNASANDLDAARTAFEAATAQVQSVQNRVRQAELAVQYTRMTAPRPGTIAAVHVEPNQNVQAGQTIVVLTSGDQLEVRVAVPEVLITGINDGDSVTVTFDALPNEVIPAQVTEVGVVSGGFATTYPVTVRLNASNPNIRAGMAAEVAFSFARTGSAERFFVPAVAVGEDQDGRFVWIVERTDDPSIGIVRRRPVIVGELTTEGLEIVQGLADGEEVVTAGVSKVSEGLSVSISDTNVEES